MVTVPDINRLARILRRAGKRLTTWRRVRSPSGTGWHLILFVSPPCDSLMEVVALQACCGSDPLREACNVQRVRTMGRAPLSRFWRDRWNVLYA